MGHSVSLQVIKMHGINAASSTTVPNGSHDVRQFGLLYRFTKVTLHTCSSCTTNIVLKYKHRLFTRLFNFMLNFAQQ